MVVCMYGCMYVCVCVCVCVCVRTGRVDDDLDCQGIRPTIEISNMKGSHYCNEFLSCQFLLWNSASVQECSVQRGTADPLYDQCKRTRVGKRKEEMRKCS